MYDASDNSYEHAMNNLPGKSCTNIGQPYVELLQTTNVHITSRAVVYQHVVEETKIRPFSS